MSNMKQASVDVLNSTRRSIYNALEDCSQEEWLIIPDGFKNNIAWNVGHIIIAQQGLVYTRCGLDNYINAEMFGMYRPVSSPRDWESNPDKNALIDQLMSLGEKMNEDVKAGLFDIDMPAEPVPHMPHADSVAHAMISNNMHEGMHYAIIAKLKQLIK